jgi:hypothetical protein
LRDSSRASEVREAAGGSGGFFIEPTIVQRQRILPTEVFNTFVENVVENSQSLFVSDSALRRFTTLH